MHVTSGEAMVLASIDSSIALLKQQTGGLNQLKEARVAAWAQNDLIEAERLGTQIDLLYATSSVVDDLFEIRRAVTAIGGQQRERAAERSIDDGAWAAVARELGEFTIKELTDSVERRGIKVNGEEVRILMSKRHITERAPSDAEKA